MRKLAAVAGVILFVSLIMAKTGVPTAGEVLYRYGTLGFGKPVTGSRESGEPTSGAAAACVNCHRPSGFGMVEGRTVIPPITARYLFKPGVLFSDSHDAGTHAATGRSAYTDATLAKAIREGTSPDGRDLDYLMPRYKIDDVTMSSLIAYLRQLSSGPVPGVDDYTLHFATIITPDADPAKRKGTLDVLEHFFAEKNRFYRGEAPPMQASWRLNYHVQRMWKLHVWELTGEPATWDQQLRKHMMAEPVFAAISGLGGRNWEPIHRFCEEESLPCLFPNADLPVVAEGDFYNVYFSKGVLLEAQLIARQIHNIARSGRIRRVLQIYRRDDVGVAAAQAFRQAIGPKGHPIIDWTLDTQDEDRNLTAALGKSGAEVALVMWLRPEDLQKLQNKATNSTVIFASGLMGGLEDAPLEGTWRKNIQMAYPLELPARRSLFLNYPLGWFRIQNIPLVSERTQVDTFIACSILADSLGHMLDNFVRDYLVENVERMLSSRIINGYYTRLGLAPGQRFASKGGYIVHFGGTDREKVVAEGDWIVP